MSTSEEKAAEAKKRILEKSFKKDNLDALRNDVEKSGKSPAEYVLGKEGAERLEGMFEEKKEKKEQVSGEIDLSKADLSAVQNIVFAKSKVRDGK